MARLGLWILIAGFGLSAAPMGADGADPCNDCGGHEEKESAPAAPCCDGEEHGESPASPSQPHQDFHCCCVHTQALFMTSPLEWLGPTATGRISVPIHQAFTEPSLRLTFHIPIA